MKKDKKLSIPSMAIQNLKAKKFRTIFMMFFVVLMTATFFFSTILMDNLKLGIKNTTGRMGADMIMVPREGTEYMRDSLFAGTPCSIFFDKSWEDSVRNVEGVERVSPQLYVATLSASCCDASVQLVAFDPSTDFVIQPWLNNHEKLELQDGEVVAGYNVAADVDGKIRFYDTTFQVAAKLERTGMGYDNSVFMTFDTLYKLKDSEVAQVHLPTDDLENVISMLMIDVDDSFEGMDLASLKIDIENSGPSGEKMYACTADDLMSGIASQVNQLSGYGNILIYILLIATALALISIFVITINERKYEFGILYTVGANKSQITRIILSEALIISICGGAAGVLISYYLLVEFKDIIRTQLNIPYFDIPLQMGLTVTALCMTIAIITGIIAAVCSSYRISKGEAYRLIRESE